jgi:ribonuclease BN (tRNA processing enzyme)
VKSLFAAILAGLVGVSAVASGAEQASADSCEASGLKVQVLGSGGAELTNGRAGSGYVVWIGGKARALIDIGNGAAQRFADSGARTPDLDVILLSHLHTDHTADFPVLISAATLEKRSQPLPLYGPIGNRFAPSTVSFVRALLDNTRGAYRYLGVVLSPLGKDSFKLEPREVREERPPPVGARPEDNDGIIEVYANQRLRAAATYIIHGGYPALAWRIRVGNRNIVFSGDTNGEGINLPHLAQDADLLIAHHAVPEGAAGVERYLHMPPSVIGRVAKQARVKRLVLSHRTRATLGQEDAALTAIRANYLGPATFAEDLNCFVIP